MELFDRKDVDRLIGRDWDFAFQPSIGNAGGILVLWKNSLISFQVLFKAKQYIMGSLKIAEDMYWEIAVVYADKDRYTRMAVWEDISKHHTRDVPLVVGGDFNCIMAKEEKKGGKAFHFNPAANDIASFMLANDLVDPGYIGLAFTWSNNKDIRSRIFSRLDRFLLSSSILDSFQGLKVKHLIRLASDHCPILCSFIGEVKRVYSHWIKFEDVWASYPMAWQLVKQKWQVNDVGTESVKLQKKYQRTLKALFFWSKNKIKELTQLKEDLDREIKLLQEVECSPNGLSET
ncbi:hypothetical protein KFK09_004875 [Dendrobium nobile]|uniref:Endonuclease/exonuclease/phosphatase domain-containing protein n=1 Tax=Dendrobium nobile TaxID=94219 RepID=A0A8T3BZQ1_DENNO|nr:hypothetical protein KFK09_004875 [Dendrobium nobile]